VQRVGYLEQSPLGHICNFLTCGYLPTGTEQASNAAGHSHGGSSPSRTRAYLHADGPCTLLRLHTETACRRGGALALRPRDLDPDQCLIPLREKGETVRWQPVSPTLMARLTEHGRQRYAPPDGQLLRYAGGRLGSCSSGTRRPGNVAANALGSSGAEARAWADVAGSRLSQA
jgi:integrase